MKSIRSIRKQLGAATIEYALIAAAVIAISTAVLQSGGDYSLYDAIMTKVGAINSELTGQ